MFLPVEELRLENAVLDRRGLAKWLSSVRNGEEDELLGDQSMARLACRDRLREERWVRGCLERCSDLRDRCESMFRDEYVIVVWMIQEMVIS